MSTDNRPLPLKDLINFLFEHVHHPDGRPYLTQEVAARSINRPLFRN